MTAPSSALESHYDYFRVALSVLLSMMGAYSAIEMAERVTAAAGRMRLIWLGGGALAVGVGVWSMHYMGMFAYILPIPVAYDWPTALWSYVLSVFGGAVALFVVSRSRFGAIRAIIGGIVMGGVGISGQHYTAMASMRLDAQHQYSVPLVALSVLVAIALSIPSLWQMFMLREDAEPYSVRKMASCGLLGLAIPAMHYTAMASVNFVPSPELCDPSRAVGISTLGLLALVAGNVCVVAAVGLTSAADRLRSQRALLDELFERSPQPVALLDLEQRVVRANHEFERVFGFTPAEAMGRPIAELIARDRARDEEASFAQAAARSERIEVEGVRWRKDGTPLHVEILRVPVLLAKRRVLVYAIYRDITGNKQAADALRRANEQLHELSRRIFSVQEEDRRHLARELHDEMAQALTAAKLALVSAQAADELPEVRRHVTESLGILDQLLQKARNLSLDLRPPLLDDLGLVPALRWYLDQQAQRGRAEFEFAADPAISRLAPEVETASFRVAQEAITNALRHGQARRIAVELDQTADALHLTVRDDGRGFDVPAAWERAKRGGGLGLAGMQERVVLLGGELDIRSRSGEGTEVHAFFPIGDHAQP